MSENFDRVFRALPDDIHKLISAQLTFESKAKLTIDRTVKSSREGEALQNLETL